MRDFGEGKSKSRCRRACLSPLTGFLSIRIGIVALASASLSVCTSAVALGTCFTLLHSSGFDFIPVPLWTGSQCCSANIQTPLSIVELGFSFIGEPFTRVCNGVPLVGGASTCISDIIATISDELSFVGFPGSFVESLLCHDVEVTEQSRSAVSASTRSILPPLPV